VEWLTSSSIIVLCSYFGLDVLGVVIDEILGINYVKNFKICNNDVLFVSSFIHVY
jgi:hypothetical protein